MQEGYYLRPVGEHIGTEMSGVGAIGDAVCEGPNDRIEVVGGGAYVLKGTFLARRDVITGGVQVRPVKERHHLTAGGALIGAEMSGVGAVGDAVRGGPHYRIVIVGCGPNICEGAYAVRCIGFTVRAEISAVQEGDYLCACGVCVGAEMGLIRSVGDTGLIRPFYGFIKVVAFFYVRVGEYIAALIVCFNISPYALR